MLSDMLRGSGRRFFARLAMLFLLLAASGCIAINARGIIDMPIAAAHAKRYRWAFVLKRVFTPAVNILSSAQSRASPVKALPANLAFTTPFCAVRRRSA